MRKAYKVNDLYIYSPFAILLIMICVVSFSADNCKQQC